jgi:hypothetical protein
VTTRGRPRTFIVECYAPGIDEAAVAAAVARARAAVARLAAGGDQIEYEGAVLVAEDEVVFHTFGADRPEVVERASLEAGLGHERVVESIAIDGKDIRSGGRPTPGE